MTRDSQLGPFSLARGGLDGGTIPSLGEGTNMDMTRKDFLKSGLLAGALALAGKARADEPGAAAKPEGAAEPAPKHEEGAPAAAHAPPPPSAIHFPVIKAGDYDDKKMWAALKTKKKHKFVFMSVQPHLIVPGLASLYIHVQNALNAGEVSFGWGHGKVASAAVLLGPSVVLGLNDAMWAKYPFGEMFNLKDAAGKPEKSNVYYKAQTNLSEEGDAGAGGNIYQDWSAEACIKRGTAFMVCHNALTAFAGMMAMQGGGDPHAAVAEWKAALLPGFMIVPAGVGALHAAMEHGWNMMPLL
jgi:hypothetical protein